MSGVPSASQRSSDYHLVTADAFGSATYRSTTDVFHTMTDRSIALPPELPGSTPTAVAGPYKRLRYQITLPSDLTGSASFFYGVDDEFESHWVELRASAAYIGGTTLDLLTPDWSATAGFDPTWVPSGAHVDWGASAKGDTRTNLCTDGAHFVTSSRSGTF
jgi:hypothetical protein